MGNEEHQRHGTSVSPQRHLDRRGFLVGAVGAAGLALAGCSSSEPNASGPTARASTSVAPGSSVAGTATASPVTVDPRACRLIPEMTAGPYYLEDMAVRRDIVEDRPGIPLEMAFTVIDAHTCEPLADAAVDIWCCDANGEYAGWNGNTLQQTMELGRNDNTFLRGIQLTDADGVATFDMIHPGWYEGRAIHIHLKVHTGGEADDTYEGGHVNHVGQVFFDDGFSDELMALEPYAAHTGTRTRNDADSIHLDGGDDQIVTVTAVDDADPAAGLRGAITLAVDPDARPDPLPVA